MKVTPSNALQFPAITSHLDHRRFELGRYRGESDIGRFCRPRSWKEMTSTTPHVPIKKQNDGIVDMPFRL